MFRSVAQRTLSARVCCVRLSVGLLAAIVGLSTTGGHAQVSSPLYWNAAPTGDWGLNTNWWTTPAGTTTSVASPTSTNDAVFNASSITGNETVTLSGPQAALGLYFNNPGSTLLESSSSTAQTLSLGSDGITIAAGAGVVTLGDLVDGLNLSLTGPQTWTNNSGSLLKVVNSVDNGGNLLTLAGAGSGGFTFSGAITGNGGLTMNSRGTLLLTGANTYSGTTTVAAGTVTLDFTQAGAPTSNIINNQTSNSALIMAGGTLQVNGAGGSLQQFNGLSLTAGASSIIANSTAGSVNISLGGSGTINRGVGATLNFTLPGSGSITTGYSTTNSLLGPGITVNGTDWATVNSGAVAAASYTVQPAVGSWGSNQNITANGAFSGQLGGNLTISSLRFNANTNSTVALNSKTLTVLDGVLITNNVGSTQAQIGANSSSRGNLQGPSGGDLVLINNDNNGNLTIYSVMTDNGGSGLTYSGVSSANTYINTNASFTGNVTLNGGNITANAGSHGNNTSALGNPTTAGRTVTVNNGANLWFNSGNALADGGVTPGLAMIINQGGTVTMNSASNNAIGALTLNGGTITGIPSGGAGWLAWNLNGGSVTTGGPSFSTMSTTNQAAAGAGFNMAATTTFTVAPVPIESNGADLVVSAPLGDRDNSFNAPRTANLIKAGLGTMAIASGYGSFTGDVTLNTGAINVTAASGSGTNASPTVSALGNMAVARTITINSNTSLNLIAGNALANGFAAPTATIVVNAGGLLTSGSATSSANNPIGPLTLNGGTITGTPPNYSGWEIWNLNGGLVTVGGSSYSTMTSTNPTAMVAGAPVGGYTMAATTTFSVAQVATEFNGADLVVSAPLDNENHSFASPYTASLVKTGSGTMLLSATNYYSGGTTINLGTVRLSGNSTSGGFGGLGATSGSLTMGGGTLDLGGTSQSIGNLTGASGTILNSTPSTTATLTIGMGDGTGGSYAGLIQDNASTGGVVAIVKTGGGALALTGSANTYSGGTTLGGGTLRIANGALGSGAITFTGGTLQYATGANQDVSGKILNSTSPIAIDINGQSVSFGAALAGSNVGGLAVNSSATGGVLTLNAANTYTAATTVNSGTLALGAGGSLGNTAISVAPGATFSARPGSGTLIAGSTTTVGAGASLTLGASASPGASFDMVDSAIGTFNLREESTFGPGLILGGSNPPANAPLLTFEIDGAGHADALNVSSAVSIGSSGANLAIVPLASATSLQLGNYTVMRASGGLGPSALTLTTTLLTVGGHSYSASLLNSTPTQEIVTITNANAFPASAYWNGGQSAVWSTQNGPAPNTNWSTDASSAHDTSQVPGPQTNVFFTVTGGGANLGTTLGQDFTINSLNFTADANSSGSVGGNNLKLNATSAHGNTAGVGIKVASGAAPQTIGSNIVLGASQTWINNSSNAFTVSGNVGDAGNNFALAIGGTGPIVLSGTTGIGGAVNIGAGATLQVTGTINAAAGVSATGNLNINSPAAFGASSLTLNSGARLDNTTAAAIINANQTAISWAGDFSYGGTQSLDLGTGGVSATLPAHTITLAGATTSQLSFSGTVTNTSAAGQTLTVNGPGATLALGGYALTSGAANVTDVIAGTGNVTLTGPVVNGGSSSASGLTYSGAGTLRINASSTYAGATNVNSGAVVLGIGGQNGALPNSAITVAAGAELQTAVQDATGYGVTAPLTISGTLRKLAGAFHETLNRPTVLSGGTITAADAGDTHVFNQFGSQVSTAPQSGNSYITLPPGGRWLLRANGATNASFSVAAGSTLNVDAVLANFDASNPLIFNDVGTLVLLGANTYTGGSTVAAGTLQLGDGATKAGVLPGPVQNNGLIVFNNPGAQTYSGAITGAGAVSKIGGGTETLVAANGYNGGTTISGGTLAVQSSTGLGAGAVTLAGGRLQLGSPAGSVGVHFGTDRGAKFNLAANQSAGASGFAMSNWNNAPGNNTTSSAVTSPVAGSLVDNNGNVLNTSVAWSGGGTFSFSGTLGASADDVLMGSFTNNNGATTFTVNNVPYANYTVVAYLGNEGGGANNRNASITIGGTTYYYNTSTNAAANPFVYTQITNTSAASHPAGNYAVFTGLSGNSFTATLNSTGNSGVMGLEIVNATAPLALTNAVTVTADSTIDVTGNASAAVGGILSIGSNTLSVTGGGAGPNTPYALTLGPASLSGNPTFNVSNNGSGLGTLNIDAINDHGTARVITVTGAGMVNLSAAATSVSTGALMNITSGTLRVGAAGALGSTAQVVVAAPATFSVTANQTISSLAGAGAVSLGSGATLTVGSSDNLSSASFTGAIGGQGALAVGGTGVLTLSTANSYAGGTTVNSGTLRLTYALGTSTGTGNVTLNGGTLTTGPLAIVAGDVVAGGGAHVVSPGGQGAIGTLSVGGMSINSGTTLQFDLGPPLNNGSYAGDLILLGSDGLSVSGNPVLSFTTSPTTVGDYRLFSGALASGSLSNIGFAQSPPSNLTYSVQANPSGDPGYIDLVVASNTTPIGSGSWTGAGGDLKWTTANNWQTGQPIGAGLTATFDATGQAATTGPVVVEGPKTVGAIVLNTPSGGYTIGAGASDGALTMDNTSGAGPAAIRVTAGSHVIAAPVVIPHGATVTTAADPSTALSLTVTGPINVSGELKKAGAGTLELRGPSALNDNSGLNVTDSGTLKLNIAGTPHVGAGVVATVGPNATLELAGTVSALADPSALSSAATQPTLRAAIKLDGVLRVDADAIQQVGGIDSSDAGAGSVVLDDNLSGHVSSLIADHLNVNALTIGAGATFTLNASSASGVPTGPLGSSRSSIGSLAGHALLRSRGLAPSTSLPAQVSTLSGLGSLSVSAVPEPTTAGLLMAAIACGAMTYWKRIRVVRRRSA